MYVTRSTVKISDSVLEANYDGGRHGTQSWMASAIFCDDSSLVTIASTGMSKHDTRFGAVLTLSGACTMEITDSEFSDNILTVFSNRPQYGAGAIWVQNGQLSLNSCRFLRNTAALYCKQDDPAMCRSHKYDKTKQCCTVNSRGSCRYSVCDVNGTFGVANEAAADINVEKACTCMYKRSYACTHVHTCMSAFASARRAG